MSNPKSRPSCLMLEHIESRCCLGRLKLGPNSHDVTGRDDSNWSNTEMLYTRSNGDISGFHLSGIQVV